MLIASNQKPGKHQHTAPVFTRGLIRHPWDSKGAMGFSPKAVKSARAGCIDVLSQERASGRGKGGSPQSSRCLRTSGKAKDDLELLTILLLPLLMH